MQSRGDAPPSEPGADPKRRARALERAGRRADAASAWQEAAQLDPDDVDAQIHLGLVLRDLGRDEEANEAFLAALNLHRPDREGAEPDWPDHD